MMRFRTLARIGALIAGAWAFAPGRAGAAPEMHLGETPAAKLGTVPAGFGLKVGSKAPDASLTDVSGKAQKLSEVFVQGSTYVVFYRGGWCPFCNVELHALAGAKAEFDKRGIRIVAISVDLPSHQAKTQAKNGAAFPMLSDPKLIAHQAYQVVHAVGEAERKALAGHKVDLTSYSGETHGSFAVPSVFLVDRSGVIRFVHVDQDYQTRPSVKQMLAIADKELRK